MTLSVKSLVRLAQATVGSAAGLAQAKQTDLFFYATDDAAATVETAGYFNNARAQLRVGSIIICTFANGGTPISKTLVALTVPASGNVTVGQSSVTAG